MTVKGEGIMLFDAANYPKIKEACEKHVDIEFEAPIEITAFASRADLVPTEWKAFPPMAKSAEDYARIFALAWPDARGELMKLELHVHLDGGRVLYKSAPNNCVLIRITWPKRPN